MLILIVMKKFNFKGSGELLTREQLKNVIGGSGGYGGSGGCSTGYVLTCTTPNGTEDWCRSEPCGGANQLCQAIYPAYGSEVTGQCTVNIRP